MIRKGVVIAIDDTGPAQMVTVQTSAGAVHTAEVIQPFGHATVPPINGCEAVVFGVGGDPANMVALLINPARRFGNMAIGESVLYGRGGSRVAIRNGGTIEVLAATLVRIAVPEVQITGNATITGTLTVTGDATIGGIGFLGHDHADPQGGVTGPPV